MTPLTDPTHALPCGLTLWDYYAAHALNGACHTTALNDAGITDFAARHADAMIVERAKRHPAPPQLQDHVQGLDHAPQQPLGLPRTVAQITQDRTARNMANVSDSERIVALPHAFNAFLRHICTNPNCTGHYYTLRRNGSICLSWWERGDKTWNYSKSQHPMEAITHWLDIPGVSDAQTTATP